MTNDDTTFIHTALHVLTAINGATASSFGPFGADKALVTATNKLITSNRAMPSRCLG
jgi:hypothetical protein